jgi:hypothetical protein
MKLCPFLLGEAGNLSLLVQKKGLLDACVHIAAYSVRLDTFLRKGNPVGLRNVLSLKCLLCSQIYEWAFPAFFNVLCIGLTNRKKVSLQLKITGHYAVGATLKRRACFTRCVSLLLDIRDIL